MDCKVERRGYNPIPSAKYEAERSIAGRFEQQATQFPDRLAVKSARLDFACAQLDYVANHIIHVLLPQRVLQVEQVGIHGDFLALEGILFPSLRFTLGYEHSSGLTSRARSSFEWAFTLCLTSHKRESRP